MTPRTTRTSARTTTRMGRTGTQASRGRGEGDESAEGEPATAMVTATLAAKTTHGGSWKTGNYYYLWLISLNLVFVVVCTILWLWTVEVPIVLYKLILSAACEFITVKLSIDFAKSCQTSNESLRRGDRNLLSVEIVLRQLRDLVQPYLSQMVMPVR